jgi:hypothetical protein
VAQEEVPARRRDMKRAYLILVDFVLPMPMTALMYYIWRQRTGSALFSVYVLTLGVLFGYIFPGIGTNVLHLWKFNGPLRMKNYFLHHGFMYAPYLALVFYVAFAPGTPLTWGNIIRILLCGGCLQSVLSCHHDICGVSTGMIEIHSMPARLKLSPVEIVTDFGVIGFGLVGASFAGSCLIAYHTIVVKAISDLRVFALLVAMGLAIMGLAALQYLIGERAQLFRSVENSTR